MSLQRSVLVLMSIKALIVFCPFGLCCGSGSFNKLIKIASKKTELFPFVVADFVVRDFSLFRPTPYGLFRYTYIPCGFLKGKRSFYGRASTRIHLWPFNGLLSAHPAFHRPLLLLYSSD